MNDPKTYFKRELDLGSIDAVVKSEENLPQKDRKLSDVKLYEQYPSLQNVVINQMMEHVSPIKNLK